MHTRASVLRPGDTLQVHPAPFQDARFTIQGLQRHTWHLCDCFVVFWAFCPHDWGTNTVLTSCITAMGQYRYQVSVSGQYQPCFSISTGTRPWKIPKNRYYWDILCINTHNNLRMFLFLMQHLTSPVGDLLNARDSEEHGVMKSESSE